MAKDRFEERWRRTQDAIEARGERPQRSKFPGEALARALNLSIEPTSDGALMSGAIAGLDVHVALVTAFDRFDLVVRIRGRSLPAGLEIKPQRSEAFAFGDVRTGDAELDPKALIRGHPLEVISVLDHEARRLLIYLLPHGLVIEGGDATLTTLIPAKRGSVRAASDIQLTARLLAEMSLARKAPADRLKRIIRADPVAQVRARAYALLEEHAPGILDREIARAGRFPENIAWRLRLRGEPLSDDALLDVAATAVADDTATPEERARWLTLLAERSGPSKRVLELAAAVMSEGGALQAAATRALLTASGSGFSLAMIGEDALLVLLREGDREQKLAAINALGECGGKKVIDPLLELAAGFFVRRALKDAARAAIAAIERRTGQGRGFLSVTPLPGGEVSIAQGGGEMSLTDED